MEKIPPIVNQMASNENLSLGESLFRNGAVLDMRPDSRGAVVRLASRPGKFETVNLTVKFQSLISRCSCGVAMSKTLCAHGVAASLYYRTKFPQKFDYCFSDPISVEREETVWSQVTSPLEDDTRSALKTRKLADIVKDLASFKGRLSIYALDVPQGESRWHKISFRVTIEYKNKTFASANIRRILNMENAAGAMSLVDFPPQDIMLMRYLNTNADRKGDIFQMNAHAVSGFFHCLSGFSRFFVGHDLTEISARPVTLKLLVTLQNEGCKIQPFLKVEGQGLLKPRGCSILAGMSGYWIGIDGKYHWLAGIADVQWVSGFLKGETVFLSHGDFVVLRQACKGNLLPIDIEVAENSAVFTQEECVPVMNLDWNDTGIRAIIFFQYTNHVTTKGTDNVVWNGSKFIWRDLQKEAEVYAGLIENNFELPTGSENTFHMDNFDSISVFLLTILPELSQTWKIYYSDNFSKCARHIKPVKMTVLTVEENESSVELAMNLYLDEEEIMAWPLVIRAIRASRELVKLKDGRLIRIDKKIHKTLSKLPQLEALHEGLYRFPRYMSMLVNNALGSYIPKGVDSWRDIDEKLLHANHKPIGLSKKLTKNLRPYQKDGVAWLQAMKATGFNAVLADEMGLGKTIQALGMLAADREQRIDKPSLVICPKSLTENWLNECSKFTPGLKAKVISGADRLLDKEEVLRTDLVITSYALIRRDINFYATIGFENLILDEAQNIKNHKSQTAQACRALKSCFKLILSGTPIENSIREVWSIFDFLLPGLLGSANDFRKHYEGDLKQQVSSAEQSQAGIADLVTKIKPFILRRLKKDLLTQLPAKQEQILYCKLNEKQQELYNAIASEVGTIDDVDYTKKRFAVLALLLKLRQVCCHPDLVATPGGFDKMIESAKFELLKELVYEIKNGTSRALVFSQFTSMLKIIAAWLTQEGIKFEYLDGSTQNRQAKVDKFNNDQTIPIFLLSLKAGGTGLNLTGADTVIHYDMWWNPQVEDQATDRTHRIGQTKAVNVIKLVVQDSIEEKVLNLQRQKRSLFENLMKGMPQKLGQLTKEDLKFLLGE